MMKNEQRLPHVFSGVAMKSSRWLFAQLVVMAAGLAVAFRALESGLPALNLEGSGLSGWVMRWPLLDDIAAWELVGSPQASALVSDQGAWSGHVGKLVAITFVDYVFIYVYSVGLALVLTGGAVYLRKRWPRPASFLAGASWLPFIAGGADAIENAALLSVLAGRNTWLADVAQWAATIKFLIIALVLLLIIGGLGLATYTKLTTSDDDMTDKDPAPATPDPEPDPELDPGLVAAEA